MITTRGYRCTLTRHALQVCVDKGFTLANVRATFSRPSEIYPSGSHPGQWRNTGHGLCLVGVPSGDTFTVITLYQDRVITPLRPDQIASGVIINRKG